MHHPTFDADAASILFNLPGYRVVSAAPASGDQPRRVLIETIQAEGACPACGVFSAKVQARPVQHVKDVSCGGDRLDVLYVKEKDSVAIFSDRLRRIAAALRIMRDVKQESHVARVGSIHQRIDLFRSLPEAVHVIVIRHRDSDVPGALASLGQQLCE